MFVKGAFGTASPISGSMDALTTAKGFIDIFHSAKLEYANFARTVMCKINANSLERIFRQKATSV